MSQPEPSTPTNKKETIEEAISILQRLNPILFRINLHIEKKNCSHCRHVLEEAIQ